MNAKNKLSSLLGSYLSESENDDDDHKNSFSQEIGNLIDEICESNSTKINNLPKTDWTQCIDTNTGHPYYWNVLTKEVTWRKPVEYEIYLNEIQRVLGKVPDDWVIGYTGDEKKYFMNTYTREISWEKPINFKENKKSKKPKKRKYKKTDDIKHEKVEKRNYPKHLEPGSDEEVKIELIKTFSSKSESSSEDEGKRKQTLNKVPQSTNNLLKTSKVNLVAAYETDDDEMQVNSTPQTDRTSIINSPESSCASQTSINVSTKHRKITSFASIITGGKNENEYNEEIDKLKKELEISDKKNDNTLEENFSTNSNKITVKTDFDEKNFKRKRRFEFGTKSVSGPNLDDLENENTRPAFAIDSTDDQEIQKSIKLDKKTLYSNFTKSHVEFFNSEDNQTKPKKNENTVLEISNDMKLDSEIKDLSETILGKLQFLSVAYTEVSVVQAMQIQLETLMAAFKSSSLSAQYLFKWLKKASDDLLEREQNVAPAGWKCQWDRGRSQYFYANLKTDEIRWEYPDQDSVDGNLQNAGDTVKSETHSGDCDDLNKENSDEEVKSIIENGNSVNEIIKTTTSDEKGVVEMDISTTPPPNENEKIYVQNLWDAENAPPPPRISVPSPKPTSISDELSAFYSDIAKLSTEKDSGKNLNEPVVNLPSSSLHSSELNEIQKQQLAEKRKRKKVKVAGSSLGDKGVTEMVAKWQKAQQQKTYNFWSY